VQALAQALKVFRGGAVLAVFGWCPPEGPIPVRKTGKPTQIAPVFSMVCVVVQSASQANPELFHGHTS